jgi:LacI family transcriptional regulator
MPLFQFRRTESIYMPAKPKRVKHIALAVPLDIVYIERLLPGILEFARQQGGWVFTRVPERLSSSIEWLRGWQGDGAFVLTTSREDARIARSLPFPVVNVGGYLLDSRIPTVTVDQQMIGRMGAEHLLARRFRRFGFYGSSDLWYSQQRRAGFQSAIEASGNQCEVLEVPSMLESPRKWSRGRDELAAWLLSLQPPVGIMASWDLRAGMVVEASARVGLRVPEEIAVIGVDNDPVACEFSIPQLSSVSRNDKELGRQAAVLLAQLIEGKRPPTAPILIPPDGVVPRRSTETLAIEDPVVALVVETIRDHLGEVFGVERILSLTSLSRRQLEQRFLKSVGSAPCAFINELRVGRAKQLLTQPNKQSLSKIAAECGFSELRQFRQVFRRLTNASPAEYRRQAFCNPCAQGAGPHILPLIPQTRAFEVARKHG